MNAKWFTTLLFALVTATAALQAQTDKHTPNYLLFKVSELSWDDNFTFINDLATSRLGLDTSGGIKNDEATSAFKLTEGIYFTKNFAVEGSAAYIDDSKFLATDATGFATTIRLKTFTADLVLVGVYPFNERFEGYGQAGAAYYRVDYEALLQSGDKRTTHDNGVEPLYGVGLRYKITDSFLIDLQAQQHDISAFGVSFASLGLGFRF